MKRAWRWGQQIFFNTVTSIHQPSLIQKQILSPLIYLIHWLWYGPLIWVENHADRVDSPRQVYMTQSATEWGVLVGSVEEYVYSISQRNSSGVYLWADSENPIAWALAALACCSRGLLLLKLQHTYKYLKNVASCSFWLKKNELALPLNLRFSLLDYSHNSCTYSDFIWHKMCID